MLMALSTCYEIGQADMASIAGVTDGILLDCTTTSHMFSKRHLFSSYQPLTNNEYVTVELSGSRKVGRILIALGDELEVR